MISFTSCEQAARNWFDARQFQRRACFSVEAHEPRQAMSGAVDAIGNSALPGPTRSSKGYDPRVQ